MNILLLSMPDSFEHMPSFAIRIPNGALTSLAGNIDNHHRVAVADLILVQGRVKETLTRLVKELKPDLVGLSVMTFQRKTAQWIIGFIRGLKPDVQIVVGGYDPSLAHEAYTDASQAWVDFIVRGEGEITLRELVRALEAGHHYDHIPGLSFRKDGRFWHNRDRSPSTLATSDILPPNRNTRVLRGYTMLGRQIDVIETSRGCTYDCSFCSIVAMRGRNFHTYSFDRVVADIRDAYDHGARAIFIVDDNITLNVPRFEALCHAIIDAGLNSIDFSVQAMTSSIANHGERLAPLMRKAGFRYVFLGIENILEMDLTFLRATTKNARRESGRIVGNASIAAIEHLHRNKMYVIGGLIVGNPEDTRDAIDANIEFVRRYVDWPYIQHPTPYPRTEMASEFRGRGLITIEGVEQYDGTTAVVRTQYLSGQDVEYLRWKAERWFKVRHVLSVFFHDPLFILFNAPKMISFTFRGSTLRSLLGLEEPQKVFERYREIRNAERVSTLEIASSDNLSPVSQHSK